MHMSDYQLYNYTDSFILRIVSQPHLIGPFIKEPPTFAYGIYIKRHTHQC